MTPEKFDILRNSFRHKMIEKPLEELRSMSNVFERFNEMEERQRELLLCDMRLMVQYKERMDFQAMMKSMDFSFDDLSQLDGD